MADSINGHEFGEPSSAEPNFDVWINGIKTVPSADEPFPAPEIRLVSEPVSTERGVEVTFREMGTGQELVLTLKPDSTSLAMIRRIIAKAGGFNGLVWDITFGTEEDIRG